MPHEITSIRDPEFGSRFRSVLDRKLASLILGGKSTVEAAEECGTIEWTARNVSWRLKGICRIAGCNQPIEGTSLCRRHLDLTSQKLPVRGDERLFQVRSREDQETYEEKRERILREQRKSGYRRKKMWE